MSQVKSIDVDKRMAGLSGVDGDPHNEMKRIKVTITVVDDNNQPAALPVAVSSGRGPESVLFFDYDFNRIPQKPNDRYIHVWSLKNGQLTLYVCGPFPVIFNLIVNVETPPYGIRQATLVFFDYDVVPGALFPAPNIVLTGGQVDIPSWTPPKYGTSANVNFPQDTLDQYIAAATVCNSVLLKTGEPRMLTDNFVVPYQTLLTGGRPNQLAYLLDTGTNGLTSPTSRFPAYGQALVMPDPDKSAMYTAPQWQYGPVTQLTTSDIWQGLTLEITLVDGVQENDTYDIYLYLNGYDKYGNYIPAAPPRVYTITAPAGATAGQSVPYTISKDDLLGYRRKDYKNYGYMWADCYINKSAWTFPWGPIMIDFPNR